MPASMAQAPDPDAPLMRRVKRGDRHAFTALVNKYRQPILNFLHRTLGDLTEAEDLAQATFVQVYKFAHRYRDNARFSTWLYTIARNLCLNEIRRRTRHPAESLNAPRGENPDAAPWQLEDRSIAQPVDQVLEAELESKIQEALTALPPNQRVAVLLCRDPDLSYEDIARILGCSVSATKSLIHRGRESLKARLKPYLRTGAWNPGTRCQKL
jgi:RNA polymerase sigma-70 factor (ECF subfamily)